MCQSVIVQQQVVDDYQRSLISNSISPQVQIDYHVLVFEEIAKLKNMFVGKRLIFNLNDDWHRDAPALNRCSEVLVHCCTLDEYDFLRD